MPRIIVKTFQENSRTRTELLKQGTIQVFNTSDEASLHQFLYYQYLLHVVTFDVADMPNDPNDLVRPRSLRSAFRDSAGPSQPRTLFLLTLGINRILFFLLKFQFVFVSTCRLTINLYQ